MSNHTIQTRSHQVWVRTQFQDWVVTTQLIGQEEFTVLDCHWLFGEAAVILLSNLLQFYEKNKTSQFLSLGRKNVFRGESEFVKKAIQGIYTIDPATGYLGPDIIMFEEAPEDPADESFTPNTDGITLIDLVGDKPTYCFMAINGMEPVRILNEVQEGVAVCEIWKPMSAHDYASIYDANYLDDWIDNPLGKRQPGSKVFKVLRKAVKQLDKYETMTPKRVTEFFPSLFG